MTSDEVRVEEGLGPNDAIDKLKEAQVAGAESAATSLGNVNATLRLKHL